MPQPLKYKKSRQTHRKEGVKSDPTAKERVRAWRKRKLDAAAKATPSRNRKAERTLRFTRLSGDGLAGWWRGFGAQEPPDLTLVRRGSQR